SAPIRSPCPTVSRLARYATRCGRTSSMARRGAAGVPPTGTTRAGRRADVGGTPASDISRSSSALVARRPDLLESGHETLQQPHVTRERLVNLPGRLLVVEVRGPVAILDHGEPSRVLTQEPQAEAGPEALSRRDTLEA